MVRTATSAANCDLEAYTCEGLPGFATDPLQLVAPNGSVAAFARSHDVWLRDLADGTERRLSQDGVLLLPNRDHFFTHEPYFIRRRWDYFVRHLLGAEPPAGYSLP